MLKAVLREKNIDINTPTRNTKQVQINNPMLNFKLLEEKEKVKPIVNTMEKIIKTESKINIIETKKMIQK